MENHTNIFPDIPSIIIIFKTLLQGENFTISEENGRRTAEAMQEAKTTRAAPRRLLKSKPPIKAARLPYFSQAWHQVTTNSLILNIVCNGYKIQFISTPHQSKFKPRTMSIKNTNICKQK